MGFNEDVWASCTWESFHDHFSTEEASYNFLFRAKWPEGFSCPRCGHKRAYIVNTRKLPLYECRACRHQTSLIAGTILERSRTSLKKWICALWLVSRTDKGINAIELSTRISVTYKTAWSMLRKIRSIISQSDTDLPLSGIVQAGYTFFDRPYNSTIYRDSYQHPLLVGASLSPADQLMYFKIKLVPPTCISRKNLLRTGVRIFTEQHVSSKADDISINSSIFQFYKNRRLKEFFNKSRAWITDTFHGLSSKYLQSYLDEFCFRYNLTLHHIPIFDYLSCLSMNTRTRVQLPFAAG